MRDELSEVRDAALLQLVEHLTITMLFVTGCAYGRCVGHHAWKLGIAMVLLGAVLSALIGALGG